MNRKIYKELCKECDKRTIHVFNVFNKVINEYEENAKSPYYKKLLNYARYELVLNLQVNKRIYESVKEEFYNIQKSTKYGAIKKIKILYWLSSIHNYYVITSNTLIETAKENGILGEDETKINIREVLENE